jgi:hypothetical protein
MYSDNDGDNYEKLHGDNGNGDGDDVVLAFGNGKNDSDSATSNDTRWYQKPCFKNCLLFLFGILCTLGGQVLFFEIGLIQFPESDTTLTPPSCYACVGIPNLDGTYQSVIDMKVTGIEFKVKTIQVFHGDASTVDTIVDVVKDPVGIFSACECDGVGFKLGGINCTVDYAYDKCVEDCDSANGITELYTLYDPKSDQLESSIIVSVLGVDVQQVAVFTRVSDDQDDDA